MPMNPVSMGRKGGKVKSVAKAKSAAKNLEIARKTLKALRSKVSA